MTAPALADLAEAEEAWARAYSIWRCYVDGGGNNSPLERLMYARLLACLRWQERAWARVKAEIRYG